MNLPATIARYHVIGRIAAGGMAEILLAKVLGPGGFELPVVIKRVLPHLASQQEFRGMFLDEARIVAAIRHPNVVHVHELGLEGENLYLAMEYLAGESVRSLSSRAAARNVRLDLSLCAHIVAEACAGLHAAHEFTGPDGKSLHVVHRDVCPNNLIVTYDGSVKVVDFGIAQAAHRFTMTDAGQIKGKAAYMSPEQCLQRPVDRRTDVFALGVVLYELTTGHQLFGKGLESRILSCVRGQEVQPPSRVVSGYPKDLERICLRALRLSPDERFASAEEMRRELVRFQRARSSELLPEEQLKRVMQALFQDRIEEKADLLSRLRAGSGVSHIPTQEISDHVSVPVVETDRNAQDLASTAATTCAPPGRSRGRRQRLLGGALFVSACLVASAVGLTVDRARVARLLPANALMLDAPSAPFPVGSTVSDVELRFESQPRGARVWLDSALRGVTPLAIRVPRGGRPLSLRVELPGYAAVEQTLVPSEDQRLSVALPRPPERQPLQGVTFREDAVRTPLQAVQEAEAAEPTPPEARGLDHAMSPRPEHDPAKVRDEATKSTASGSTTKERPTNGDITRVKRRRPDKSAAGGDEFFLFD